MVLWVLVEAANCIMSKSNMNNMEIMLLTIYGIINFSFLAILALLG